MRVDCNCSLIKKYSNHKKVNILLKYDDENQSPPTYLICLIKIVLIINNYLACSNNGNHMNLKITLLTKKKKKRIFSTYSNFKWYRVQENMYDKHACTIRKCYVA